MSNAKNRQYGKSKRGPKSIDWDSAELDYVYSADATHSVIAKKYGVSTNAVARESGRRKWGLKRARARERILAAAAKRVEDAHVEGIQRGISLTLATQIDMAAIIRHYPNMLKAKVADWHAQFKSAREKNKNARPPKLPISANEFNAIVQAQRHLLAWEMRREGKPGEIQQNNVVTLNLIDFLSGGSDSDG